MLHSGIVSNVIITKKCYQMFNIGYQLAIQVGVGYIWLMKLALYRVEAYK
jgi:hypothetical protein